ncbi:lysostaphin resistance A-like protein [Chloroflexota bacterium]
MYENNGINQQPETENIETKNTVWGPWYTAGFGFIIGVCFMVVQAGVAVAYAVPYLVDNPYISQSDYIYELLEKALTPALLASSFVGVILILFVIKLRRNATIMGYLGFARLSKQSVIILLGLSLGLAALTEYVRTLIGGPESEIMVDAYKTTSLPALMWIAIVIFAPVFEEAFFRGFLFAGFGRSRMGYTITIILTSFLWTILHVQYGVYEITVIFIMGLILGAVRLKTGSIFSSLVVHAFWNFLAMISILLYVYGIYT